jgi:hypothetical protein
MFSDLVSGFTGRVVAGPVSVRGLYWEMPGPEHGE